MKTTLINDCKEGLKPSHYCINSIGASFVFSSKFDMNEHIKEELLIYSKEDITSGEFEDLEEFEIINYTDINGKLRGTNENYLKENPFRK